MRHIPISALFTIALLFLQIKLLLGNRQTTLRMDRHETIVAERCDELHPVKKTEKKYKVFPAGSHSLLAAFYAARPSSCFSIGVNTPRLRCTRLVL